jgi:hypothetical protein
MLVSIFTYVTAQEKTIAIDKSLQFRGFSAAGDNGYVEMSNNLSEIVNLKYWVLVINEVQIPLPEHSLQSGQILRVHLGKKARITIQICP